MTHAILSLNYLHVLVVTVVGFLFGWLWHSPLLFSRLWLEGLKLTEEDMQERGMVKPMVLGFLFTFISTFGLAAFLNAHRPTWWGGGALVGGFVGLCIVGARFINNGVWEQRSWKLIAINAGHEFLLFAIQGTILAVWR